MLVPISLAELDDEFREVRLPHVQNAQLSCLPDYRGEPLTPERERAVAACFTGIGSGDDPSAEAH